MYRYLPKSYPAKSAVTMLIIMPIYVKADIQQTEYLTRYSCVCIFTLNRVMCVTHVLNRTVTKRTVSMIIQYIDIHNLMYENRKKKTYLYPFSNLSDIA